MHYLCLMENVQTECKENYCKYSKKNVTLDKHYF